MKFLLPLVLVATLLPASTPAQSFWVNRGGNGRQDVQWGEFGVDLGGMTPFASFSDPRHPLRSGMDTDVSLRQIVLDGFTNLVQLHVDLERAGCNAGVLPPQVFIEPGYPKFKDPWWARSQDGRYLTYWNCRINGGHVQIIRRTHPPYSDGTVHVLLMNYPAHDSDFGTKGYLADDELYASAASDWTHDDSGQPILPPDAQALERGDVVARVSENYSADLWTALQRTQEAEYFVRNLSRTTRPYERFGGSFLHGGSWGAEVSGILSLLGSSTYSGSTASFANDVGFHVSTGDWSLLMSHFKAGIAAEPPSRLQSNRLLMGMNLIVDILGVRFDHADPRGGLPGWDLGLLSLNHRPYELKIPILGKVGTEDNIVNWHWQSRDRGIQNAYRTQFLRHAGHDGPQAVQAGVNEFSFFTGSEWADLLAQASLVRRATPLVPLEPPESPVLPRPYSQTLRHAPCGGAGLPVLTEIDLVPDRPVTTLGQGLWPAQEDSLKVEDWDGDGRVEVLFGNLDGCFHVLEVQADAAGTPILVDEWKSPVLGPRLWGMQVTPLTGDTVWIGDGMGRVHAVRCLGPDRYSVAAVPPISPERAPGVVYPGPIPWLARGRFRPGEGEEFLLQNEQKDWVLLDSAGNVVDRLWRDHRGLEAGHGAVVDLDRNGVQELVFPGLDGHLWSVAFDRRANRLALNDLFGFTGRALYRVEPVDSSGDGSPEQLLAFGRDDSAAEGQTERILVIDVATGRRVDVAAAPRLDAPCFAWLVPPQSSHQWSFVVAAHQTLQRFTWRSGQLVAEAGKTLVPEPRSTWKPALVEEDRETAYGTVRALGCAGAGTRAPLLVVTLGNGRFYLLDQNLDFTRTSQSVDPGLAAGTEQPWYANTTFAGEMAWDWAADPATGATSLWVAEFQQPLWNDGADHYRVAQLDFAPGAAPAVTPFVLEARNRTGLRTRAHYTRFFRYRDLDQDGSREAYFLAECGALLPEPDGQGGWQVRQFCNRSIDSGILLPTPIQPALGGYLFEALDPDQGDDSLLSDFFVPVDGQTAEYRHGDWWYPRVGKHRLTGQIATPQQSVSGPYLGTSMTLASLPDPRTGRPAPHVVTGTIGGYVLAVAPGDPGNADPDRTPSSLSYSSADLGWNVVGMDVADLDADGLTEVVVGTLVDDGTFEEWKHALPEKNRGQLLVLRPNSRTRRFDVVATLTGDDLLGERGGIGSGVLGVRIDDVDGDGTPEIWCGDSRGHLYLFRRHGSTWQTVLRSAELGCYAGLYNNLFPVKDSHGRTVQLFVVSSGYLSAFTVDWTKLQ